MITPQRLKLIVVMKNGHCRRGYGKKDWSPEQHPKTVKDLGRRLANYGQPQSIPSNESNPKPKNTTESTGDAITANTWPATVTDGVDGGAKGSSSGNLKAHRIGNWDTKTGGVVWNDGEHKGEPIKMNKDGDVVDNDNPDKILYKKPKSIVQNKDKILEDQSDVGQPDKRKAKVYDGSSDKEKTDEVKRDINDNPKK